MSDLETRLVAALRGAAEQAPHPGDLVRPARARLRRRRRTTALAVTAAVAVVAIPVGIQLVGQVSEPEVTTVVPGGWRTESFRDLTLQVPNDWSFQGGPDWCRGDGAPAVTRSEGFVTNAACTPRFTYGVQFRDVPPELFAEPRKVPDDAVVVQVGTGRTSAWIVADSQEQADAIAASAHRIEGVDANGCPPVVDPDLEGTGERVSVCRYDSGELEQSELLTAEESRSAVRAVEDAPRDVGGFVACAEYSRRQPVVALRSSELSADLLPSSGCAVATRFLHGTTARIVTEDVLYWALTPGWQGNDSALPVPDPLRTD